MAMRWIPASLDDPASSMPAFTPNCEGSYLVRLVVNDGFADSAPSDVTVSAIPPGEFAQEKLVDDLNLITDLLPEEVTTGGNQGALGNFVEQAIAAIQDGNDDHAIFKIDEALERTDGCVLRGEPDGNGEGRDWITDCNAQQDAYDLLTLARDALTS